LGKKDNEPEECIDAKGKQFRCSTVEDLGCFRKVPFGALTLNDYLEKAYKINPTKNIFLMTDATPQWLEKQMATVSGWKIYVLPAVSSTKMIYHQYTIKIIFYIQYFCCA